MAVDVVAQVRTLFFDRAKVKSAVDRGKRKALSKGGAFVRRRMRSSIRKRRRVSLPGEPPSSHEGSLKRLIFFAYDPSSESVVIGPTAFKRGRVPSLLERGGVEPGAKGRPMLYRPRPFAAPALEAERDNIAKFFRDSVKAGA